MVYFKLPTDEVVEVDDSIALLWDTIKACIEDCEKDDSSTIPLPTAAATMSNVLFLVSLSKTLAGERDAYLANTDMYANTPIPTQQLAELKRATTSDLIAVLVLANFLHYLHGVAALVRYLGQSFATKSLPELKAMFDIEGALTVEDKERVSSINPWMV